MDKTRYIAIRLNEEDVARWQYGLLILAWAIERDMHRHRLTEWPTLKHVDQPDEFTWRLIFAWPARWEYTDG